MQWNGYSNFVDITNFSDNNTRTSCPFRNNKGKQKVFIDLNCVEIKSKKPRQPNQEIVEFLTLIKGQKTEHEANLIVVDSKDNMETLITEWKRISTFVMANGHSKHFRNGATCKDKWVSLWRLQEDNQLHGCY